MRRTAHSPLDQSSFVSNVSRPCAPVRYVRPFAMLLLAALTLSGCDRAGSAETPARDAQLEEAVLPLPPAEREGATVLGFGADGELATLKRGDGRFICLADDPAEARFHVACYHASLEPYMARGRELRAEGLSEREAIARRWEEIEAGALEFPEAPTALFSLHADGRESLSEGAAEAPSRLTVLYVRGATAEEMGLPTSPEAGLPWLMMPGMPTAHVMIHD